MSQKLVPGTETIYFLGTRMLVVDPKYEGISLSEDGTEIRCAPEYEAIAREWQYNPEFFRTMRTLREFIGGTQEDTQAETKLKIRNGLRLALQGIEELWGLPRSFETKREQGRRGP